MFLVWHYDLRHYEANTCFPALNAPVCYLAISIVYVSYTNTKMPYVLASFIQMITMIYHAVTKRCIHVYVNMLSVSW